MTPAEQYQNEAKELYTMPVMPAEFNSSEEHEAFRESCEWQRQRRAAYIAGRTKSDWVSVKECVPVLGQRFHGFTHEGFKWDCGPYEGNGWQDGDEYQRLVKESMLIRGFTHWQPLPEPPKP